MKGAHVSGMAAYQALVRQGRRRLRRLLGRPGARVRQLEDAVHQGAGREQGAVLQVVRGRHAERLLQLPGPQRRSAAWATRSRSSSRPTTARSPRSPTSSCWRAPASWPTRLKSLRHQEGRPRRHLHVDEHRGRGRDAGLRAHRRHPLGGVRRLLGAVACATASQDAGAVVVITADEQLRGGKQLPLKAIVDEAHRAGRLRDHART